MLELHMVTIGELINHPQNTVHSSLSAAASSRSTPSPVSSPRVFASTNANVSGSREMSVGTVALGGPANLSRRHRFYP